LLPGTHTALREGCADEAAYGKAIGLLPQRVTVTTGLTGSFEEILSRALLTPDEVGLKVTLRVQVPPAGSELHPLVFLNCQGFFPDSVRPRMMREPVPVLATVTVFVIELFVATFPNSRTSGLTDMAGVPVWLAVKVWPAMVMAPLRDEGVRFAFTE